MGALIAIQFRLMWKGTPAFLRVGWGFLLVAAFVAVRERRVDNEALAVSILWPLGMLLIGLASAVTAGESLTWFTPIPRAERTWARLTVLTLTGIVTTAAILAVPAIAHIRIALPWPQLAAHLWLCWIGGGLLLLFLGDLIQSDVPAVQIFSILLGAVPGVGLSSYHLTEKCPWEVLLAEAGGVAVLVVLTRIVNVGEEVREHHYLPKAWRQPGRPFSEQAAAVAAESTTRKLDRRPSLASLLGAGLTASRPTVTLVTLWALGSLLPVAVMHAMLGLMVLPFTFQAALNYWRPFQTVPLSRPKAFVLLTAPILAVWILLVALHCLSSSLFLNTRLTVDASDGPRWQLPAAKRNPDVELSSELRRRHVSGDPGRLAELMSEAYRACYGLDISAAQIRAVPIPSDVTDTSGRLRIVEQHFESAVSRRVLEWRVLMGVAMLAMGLLSVLGHLPGRWPHSIRWGLLGVMLTVPMGIFVLLSAETNVICNYLPAILRPAYRAIYDQPWTLTVGFAVAAAALYLRHLRVFRSSEIVESPVRF